LKAAEDSPAIELARGGVRPNFDGWMTIVDRQMPSVQSPSTMSRSEILTRLHELPGEAPR